MSEAERMARLLARADEQCAQAGIEDYESALCLRARYLIEHGVRCWGTARWVLEKTYEGKDKVMYRCSACGHYQTAKKRNNKMLYMRHCPYCGRRIVVKAEDLI